LASFRLHVRRDTSILSRLTRGLAILVALGIAAGVIFLMTWDIPAPTGEVVVRIPDDHFPK